MPKPIKTRTYYNFMRVYRAILGKGYTPETAEEITRRIFDAYEQNPALIIDNLLSTVEMLTQTAQNAPQEPKACLPY